MLTKSLFITVLSIALATAMAVTPAALAGEITGPARVVDGDTIDVGTERVRLAGIDAPEIAQPCQRDGVDWGCGQAAAAELRNLIAGQSVRCDETGRDDYGRALGVCFAGATNVNEALVQRGYAWAFAKYSSDYVAMESEAKLARVGVWQGEAQAPWDYRKGRWQTAETTAPDGCAIKGNISDQGRIYHMPWSPWYARVRIDKASGEKWFCSETEATAAGWRAVGGG
jgi:endonuclease YncB( thermonuclease family)